MVSAQGRASRCRAIPSNPTLGWFPPRWQRSVPCAPVVGRPSVAVAHLVAVHYFRRVACGRYDFVCNYDDAATGPCSIFRLRRDLEATAKLVRERRLRADRSDCFLRGDATSPSGCRSMACRSTRAGHIWRVDRSGSLGFAANFSSHAGGFAGLLAWPSGRRGRPASSVGVAWRNWRGLRVAAVLCCAAAAVAASAASRARDVRIMVCGFLKCFISFFVLVR